MGKPRDKKYFNLQYRIAEGKKKRYKETYQLIKKKGCKTCFHVEQTTDLQEKRKMTTAEALKTQVSVRVKISLK